MDQKRLRELEAKCIQDEPPRCSASCPVHVDVKTFIKEIKEGNLSSAFNILAKAVVFPQIIGRVCNRPCENHCLRNEIDQAVSIHELEKYCVSNADIKPKILPIKKKAAKVAILGGGLAGLAAAVELAKKGYAPSIYLAGKKLGGELLNIPSDILPPDILTKELQMVQELGIEVLPDQKITPSIDTTRLMDDYDAIFMACGNSTGDFIGPSDKVTLATSIPGVFGVGYHNADGSYIDSVALGKKAAISIDRYIERVSLDASRDKEGPYETKLVTNIKGQKIIPAVTAQDSKAGYTQAEAKEEAERCLLCECMECVKVCEYLKAFGSYPKKYLREIYNNEAIVMGPRLANNLINSCSLCGLCKEVCPNGLDMGEVIKKARQGMVFRGKMPQSPHDFPLKDMDFSCSSHFSMIKHAPGATASQYMYYPGCQLCATMPMYVQLSYDYLRQILPDVGLALGCCGAPADWVGQTELFHQVQERLVHELDVYGNPTLIVACSSCYDIFKNHYPELKIISLWEIYHEHGIPEEHRLSIKSEIAIHDACSARHEDGQQKAIRAILTGLGLKHHELDLSQDKTTCCGFGGLMTFANKEVAIRAIDRRVGESQAPYLVYCAMCKDRFSWRNKETFHILDLIYGGALDYESLNTLKNVGFSEKRENRARLKKEMLRELWGEYMDDEVIYPYELEIEKEALAKMEERLVLKEDILKVVHHAEATGNKLQNLDTGHYVAYYKPVTVTYWVEYSVKDNVFHIHNVYSHRMQIGEE